MAKVIDNNGKTLTKYTPDPQGMLDFLRSEGIDVTDYQIVLDNDEKRIIVQDKIAQKAGSYGDKISATMSMLGTASDGATTATILNAAFISVLATLPDTDQLKTGIKASVNMLYKRETGFDDLVADCTTYLTKIGTGEYKIPFLIKYGSVSGVFQDVGERNTAVAEALANKP